MGLMKHNCYTLIVMMVALLILALATWPAHALADVARDVLVASCTPVNGGIDLCPLIPVVNGAITMIAGLLAAATPVIVGLFAKWLYSHGISMNQQTQKIVSDRISATIQNGLKFATSGADVGIQRINVQVHNDAVRTAANYAIAQSPDLLKKAGIDVTTQAGQEALIRRIMAEAQPTPVALAQTVNTNITADKPTEVR